MLNIEDTSTLKLADIDTESTNIVIDVLDGRVNTVYSNKEGKINLLVRDSKDGKCATYPVEHDVTKFNALRLPLIPVKIDWVYCHYSVIKYFNLKFDRVVFIREDSRLGIYVENSHTGQFHLQWSALSNIKFDKDLLRKAGIMEIQILKDTISFKMLTEIVRYKDTYDSIASGKAIEVERSSYIERDFIDYGRWLTEKQKKLLSALAQYTTDLGEFYRSDVVYASAIADYGISQASLCGIVGSLARERYVTTVKETDTVYGKIALCWKGYCAVAYLKAEQADKDLRVPKKILTNTPPIKENRELFSALTEKESLVVEALKNHTAHGTGKVDTLGFIRAARQSTKLTVAQIGGVLGSLKKKGYIHTLNQKHLADNFGRLWWSQLGVSLVKSLSVALAN